MDVFEINRLHCRQCGKQIEGQKTKVWVLLEDRGIPHCLHKILSGQLAGRVVEGDGRRRLMIQALCSYSLPSPDPSSPVFIQQWVL